MVILWLKSNWVVLYVRYVGILVVCEISNKSWDSIGLVVGD